ncbi:kinase-like domain-containing protein [Staphylotrichum tortipilum]|uniref:Kinase-like domain-containing protein n=1 Tax=Staphylotrichum tortipilum TaxID=2831512 RepID=A0AAN6ML18_9PEZI|nr:kinase-like domain-containing protein [Staphylotrichum longicolle]
MSSYSSTGESYGSDEPPELDLDLVKLMERAGEVLNARCTAARKLTRGASHEVFTLEFQEMPDMAPPPLLIRAGLSCIARFSRLNGTRERSVSEMATARCLKHLTSIPVPEIYYHDLDPDNDVGAPFVLMEMMPGRHLYKIWDDLPLDSKKSALSQIASVIAQLASLKFNQIGSLDENDGIGPLISPCFEDPKGPFPSTSEFMRAFLPSPTSAESPTLTDPFEQARAAIDQFLAHNTQAYPQPPFCLIHADFDAQNMLFLDHGSGPKLTGLIDFEYSFTGPLYFLYDYPIFIQDVSWSAELYAENAVLRAHFVRAIYSALPNAETHYVQDLEDGTGLAYEGRPDYVHERYSETAELLPPDVGTDAPESHAKSVSAVGGG